VSSPRGTRQRRRRRSPVAGDLGGEVPCSLCSGAVAWLRSSSGLTRVEYFATGARWVFWAQNIGREKSRGAFRFLSCFRVQNVHGQEWMISFLFYSFALLTTVLITLYSHLIYWSALRYACKISRSLLIFRILFLFILRRNFQLCHQRDTLSRDGLIYNNPHELHSTWKNRLWLMEILSILAYLYAMTWMWSGCTKMNGIPIIMLGLKYNN
jgi:hypothetical protein